MKFPDLGSQGNQWPCVYEVLDLTLLLYYDYTPDNNIRRYKIRAVCVFFRKWNINYIIRDRSNEVFSAGNLYSIKLIFER